MKRMRIPFASLVLASVVAGCAGGPVVDFDNDPQARAKVGAVSGALLGAIIGNNVGDGENDLAGAAVGAAAGLAIGKLLDNQEAELRQALAQEQAANEIEVQRVDQNLLKLTLNNEVSFDTGKSNIKPGFLSSLSKVANTLSSYQQTRVIIVGHTDSVGSDANNQGLSERRASSVAQYLASQGVAYGRMSVEGRGEREPRADNSTDFGRAQNRRVEIFVQSNG